MLSWSGGDTVVILLPVTDILCYKLIWQIHLSALTLSILLSTTSLLLEQQHLSVLYTSWNSKISAIRTCANKEIFGISGY